MYDLYTTIKTLCKERNETVSGMCLKIGLSKSAMSDLKNGRKKSLSSKTLTKIAEFLGVPVDYLLGIELNPDSLPSDVAEYLEDLRSRPETRALLEASRGMTREQVEKMAEFAKMLRGGGNGID